MAVVRPSDFLFRGLEIDWSSVRIETPEPKEINNESLKGLLRDEEGKALEPAIVTNTYTYRSEVGGQTPNRNGHVFRGQGYERFRREYLGRWAEETDAPTIQTRTLRRNDEIINLILDEITRYEAYVGNRPSYLSLNTEAYEYFFVQMRREITRANNHDTFQMIDVVMNPTQDRFVMALGTPEQELTGRSLYRAN